MSNNRQQYDEEFKKLGVLLLPTHNVRIPLLVSLSRL